MMRIPFLEICRVINDSEKVDCYEVDEDCEVYDFDFVVEFNEDATADDILTVRDKTRDCGVRVHIPDGQIQDSRCIDFYVDVIL